MQMRCQDTATHTGILQVLLSCRFTPTLISPWLHQYPCQLRERSSAAGKRSWGTGKLSGAGKAENLFFPLSDMTHLATEQM